MHNIVIVGGGSSAHTAAPLLAKQGHKVSILTSRPEKWGKQISTKHITESGSEIQRFSADLDKVSNSYEELIPAAEIVLLCIPVFQYPDALEKVIKSAGSNKLYVGTVYGQGGFNWMVNYYSKKHNKKNITPFAIGLIPWVCRTEVYGNIGVTYGAKENNVISISRESDFDYLNKSFLPDLCDVHFKKGAFHFCNNFLSSTLSVDNQIIHTSRLYGLSLESGGEWEQLSDVPLFYKDYDQRSADLLQALDADYELIRQYVRQEGKGLNFDFMLDYLELERFSYGASTPDILTSFKESPTLGAIKTPVVERGTKVVINDEHRFFFDDIYFGLVIAKWIALKVKINTPTIDKILIWAQNVLGDEILDSTGSLNKDTKLNGVPSRWGIHSIQDLLN